MLDVCIKEIARFFSFVALPTTLLVDASWFAKKKTTHERCNCYAASLSAMVEPDSTFLRSSTLFKMDWGLRWGFLVGFCVALCFSVSRNSVLHACTAILRLVHDSDSGRASACTNFGIFIALDVFSPFAEEGFTCLDHSMLSKKKKTRGFEGRRRNFEG